jgi:hypothetical protein
MLGTAAFPRRHRRRPTSPASVGEAAGVQQDTSYAAQLNNETDEFLSLLDGVNNAWEQTNETNRNRW